MPTHPDQSSLTGTGLTHADWSLLLSSVDSNCYPASLVANSFSEFLCPTLFGVPFLLPVMSRSRAQAFVWFRAKTDKGIVCLADHLHNITLQLYGHLPPIMKTIKIRQTRHAEHRWRSRNELKSDVLPWTPSHGRAKAGRTARIYIQQVSANTGCSPEDLPEAMDDRGGWREKVRDICAVGATW